MTRTAYGIAPYGPTTTAPSLGPNAEFANEGYIFVYQDVRGKFKSEGEFVAPRAVRQGIERGRTRAPTPTTPSTGW